MYRGYLCGFVEKGLKFFLCFRGCLGRNFEIYAWLKSNLKSNFQAVLEEN
ncbi:hypothetical protein LEP1GSC188_1276 [Leptospira weilii serovar Topaz str. LT2116]|uniref:Uncharacterized protein n=1 Tax=Leptospira weilii serovar Topaz str. LT2116 TaxID=1088540 RepID=M3H3H2_9LEPT|nr:hypothetical protein LEP1GSC188_1276 [Leptospira weilii serovar Topaz str. LT2116]